MINYFNKLLTGYSLSKREVAGKKYTYKHQGKLIFFDPLLMIKECGYRISDSKTLSFELNSSPEEILALLPQWNPSIKPSTICEFQNEGMELITSRYSYRDGNRPISYYKFELDGKLLGRFYRFYDNGIYTQNLALKIASLQGTSFPLSEEKALWKSMEGEQVFIEKFGHTQVWLWNKPLSQSHLILQ